MGAGPSVYSDHEADGFILHVQYLSSYICVHSAYTETFAVRLTLRISSLRIISFVLSLTGPDSNAGKQRLWPLQASSIAPGTD